MHSLRRFFVFGLCVWLLYEQNQLIAQTSMEVSDVVGILQETEEAFGELSFDVRIFSDATAVEEAGEWKINFRTIPALSDVASGVFSYSASLIFNPQREQFFLSSYNVGKSKLRDEKSLGDIDTYYSVALRTSNDGRVLQYEQISESYGVPPQRFDDMGKAVWDQADRLQVTAKSGIRAYWHEHDEHLGSIINEVWGNLVGIGCMSWPINEKPLLLSRYLSTVASEGQAAVQCRLRENGLLEAIVTTPFSVKYFIDGTKGRIVRIEWGDCVSCETPGDSSDWVHYRIAILRYDDDTVLPFETILIELPYKSYTVGSVCKAEVRRYSNRKVLSPQNAKQGFTFEFSSGVQVTDYIAKSVYVVGTGEKDDIEATERFMATHDLHGDPEEPKTRSSSLRTWVFVCCLFVALAVFITWKRFSAVLMLAVLSSVNSGQAVAQTSGFSASVKSRDGETADSSTRRPSIRQCGQLAVAAACLYFRKQVDSGIITRVMAPSDKGTSLLQIKYALELHQLSVEPRRYFKVKELLKDISAQRLAIIPFRFPDGRGHFSVLVARSRDGKLMLADPPEAAVPVEDSMLSDESLESVAGLVLLVSVGEHGFGNAQVQPRVSTIDLGVVCVDDGLAEILRFQVPLYNASDVPALVELRTSCGCVQPIDGLMVVPPNDERNARFYVARSSWGVGQFERMIQGLVKNGGTFTVAVRGTGVRKTRLADAISVIPSSILIECTDYLNFSDVSFSSAFLKVYGRCDFVRRLKYSVSSDFVIANCSSVKYVDGEDRCVGLLELQVKPSHALFQKLSDASRKVVCALEIKADGEPPIIEVPVVIVRPLMAQAEVLKHFTTQKFDTWIVGVVSRFESQGLRIANVECLTEEHSVEIDIEQKDNAFTVRIPKGTLRGEDVVFIKVSVVGKWGNDTVVVSLKK